MNHKKNLLILSSVIGFNALLTGFSWANEAPHNIPTTTQKQEQPAPKVSLKAQLNADKKGDITSQTTMTNPAKNKKLTADDFEEEKILKALYGNLGKKQQNTATWDIKKYPDAFKEYANATALFQGKTFETKVAYYIPFIEYSRQKLFVLTQTTIKNTKKDKKDKEPSALNLMDGFIGSAIFVQKGEGWEIESESKFVAPTTVLDNGFDLYRNVNLIDIGKGKLGFTYHVNIPQQGYKRYVYLYIVTAVGTKIKPVLTLNPEVVSLDGEKEDVRSGFVLSPSTRYTELFAIHETQKRIKYDQFKQRVLGSKTTTIHYEYENGEYRKMSEAFGK